MKQDGTTSGEGDIKPSAEGGGKSSTTKDKAPPPNLVIPPKKPKLSKAERRALQEQQRAAKASNKQQQSSTSSTSAAVNASQQSQPKVTASSAGEKMTVKDVSGNTNATSKQQQQQPPLQIIDDLYSKGSINDKSFDLFSHLQQYRELPPDSKDFASTLHPAVIELGLKYASEQVRGGNDRCRSMLKVFLQALDDYIPPLATEGGGSGAASGAVLDFRTHLDHNVLKPSFTYWTTHCRPHSVSMGNAFTFLKAAVSSLDRELQWHEAKEILQETIERYMQERLDYADRAIAQHAMEKIVNGDVILTFGTSSAVSVLLTMAKEEKSLDFYVWVVDSKPLWEGRQTLQTLREHGIRCGYIQLNAVTYVLQKQGVTKVFLGASALMSDGSIYGRVGTACVALLANDNHIPVLVCSETYKISNKVQLESITKNELGNPESLSHGDSLKGWKETPNLKLLNLLYDVTPPAFVSGIVTEVGIIPPTSVAVLLREMNPQDAAY